MQHGVGEYCVGRPVSRHCQGVLLYAWIAGDAARLRFDGTDFVLRGALAPADGGGGVRVQIMRDVGESGGTVVAAAGYGVVAEVVAAHPVDRYGGLLFQPSKWEQTACGSSRCRRKSRRLVWAVVTSAFAISSMTDDWTPVTRLMISAGVVKAWPP